MGEIPFLRYHEAGDRKSKVRVPGGGSNADSSVLPARITGTWIRAWHAG